MRKQPVVELDQEKINRAMKTEQKQAFVKSCPSKVFKFNEQRNCVDVEDADKCTLCEECVKYCAVNNFEGKPVKISEREDKFIFIVESTGALPPESIVL